VGSILVILVFSAAPAVADFYTDTARFNAQSTVPADGPPLNKVSIGALSDAGRLFQNSLGPINVSGTRTNAVGAAIIDTAKVGGAAAGVNQSGLISAGSQQMVAIFGVQGVQTVPTGGAGLPRVDFTAGRLQVVEIDQGTFAQNDVTSWGFQNDLNNPAVLAVYSLKPKEAVLPGTLISPTVDSEPRSLSAGETNVAAGNIAIGADIQNVLLFEEDPQTQPVPPGSHDLLNTDSTLGGLLTALGFELVNEAVFADVDEEITGLDNSVLDGTEEGILNQIGQFGFGDVFATFGTGDDADFTVDLANISEIGDFITDLGGNFIPGLQATRITEPEPASVLAWCVIGLVGAGFAWTRRKTLFGAGRSN
jgi:hypothetical protein